MDNSTSYTRTITVAAGVDDAYRALTAGFGAWWTTACDQIIEGIGDHVQVTFQGLESRWTFKAARLEPGRRVELSCVDSNMVMLDKPEVPHDEWIGSKLCWRVRPLGDKTEIHFEHRGLTPELACYDMCEAGWDAYFGESLKAYLETGNGEPFGAAAT